MKTMTYHEKTVNQRYKYGFDDKEITMDPRNKHGQRILDLNYRMMTVLTRDYTVFLYNDGQQWWLRFKGKEHECDSLRSYPTKGDALAALKTFLDFELED